MASRKPVHSEPEGSMMSYEVERQGEALVVSPHGRLGELEAHQLERELLNLVDQGSINLVVDLSDVPFVTSSCLGALMIAYKRVKPKGGSLRIAGTQPLVRQILQITKLHKLFGLYASVEEALTPG